MGFTSKLFVIHVHPLKMYGKKYWFSMQLRPFTVITELLLTVISNSYKLLITVILTVISRDLTSYKSYL